MKKVILSVMILLATAMSMQSQQVVRNETALVYALPKTVLQFDVEIEKVEQEVGRFYLYSQRYLQATDVITENNTVYTIKSVKLRTRTEADANRQFKLVPNVDLNTTFVTLDEHGVLAGINTAVPCCNEVVAAEVPATKVASECSLPFFGEEQMLASSVSKMAELTAKQIYRIRDSRLNLLTGDVDQLPADGESLQTILAELEKLEVELCEMFVGKTTRTTYVKTVEYTPTGGLKNFVLCRLSADRGLVAPTDLSGSPVFLHIDAVKPECQDAVVSGKSKIAAGDMPAVYYNLPGKAKVSVVAANNTLLEESTAVAQFGVDLTLPCNLFYEANVEVLFDTRTGAIKRMVKHDMPSKK